MKSSFHSLRDAWWPRRGERLEPTIAAVLLALSFPPMHALVLPFVGLVPFALWIHAQDSGRRGRAATARASALFGTVYFGLLLYWILVALLWFTKLALVAFLATLGVLAGMTVLFGLMLHHAIHTARVPIWLALPVTWTTLEWARAHFPSTLAFPWLGLGTSLTAFPELVGIAEIVGSRGVTFWIALVNGILASLILRWRAGGVGREAIALVVVLVLPMGWGVHRARTLETWPVAEVAVVQPNVPEHIKLDPTQALDSTLSALDRLMPRVPPGMVDLVVMPEVTLFGFPEQDPGGEGVARVQAYAREAGAPILFGALGWDEASSLQYNSAFVMEPQSLIDFRYDKQRLVPFVERAPFGVGFGGGRLPFVGAYGAGRASTVFDGLTATFGILICYESSFPDISRRARLDGADVLLNITNDAWYGREAVWTRTTALWQHPAHMVMRAIENRVGVARSANTGISMFVDPVGRVYDATRLFEEDVRIATVRTSDVVTVYTRYGDWVGAGAAFATLLLTIAGGVLGRAGNRIRRGRKDA